MTTSTDRSPTTASVSSTVPDGPSPAGPGREPVDPAAHGTMSRFEPEARWLQRVDAWLPFVLLAVSVVVSSTDLVGTVRHAVTLALAAVAAVWILVVYVRAPPERLASRVAMAGYYVVMLGLAAVLTALHPSYFVFAINGFMHAHVLRPRPLVFFGTGATSLIVMTIPAGGFPATPEDWVGYLVIVAIQTSTIGIGVIVGEKLTELSEQRRRTVAELETTLAVNAALSEQVVAQARETGMHDERERLAREIHDTLAQGLTGVITQIEAARRDDTDPASRRRHLDNAAALARESLAEARRSVQAIGPEPLDHQHLPAAIGDVARRWTALNGVRVEVAVTGDAQAMHPEVEASLLRVVQEALANVARHAAASQVRVTLSYMGDVVAVDVRDDGVGFAAGGAADGSGQTGTGRNPATDGGRGAAATTDGMPVGGFGLVGMRQRVERIGGTLDVESAPGQGTAISATVPAIEAGPTVRAPATGRQR